MKNFKFVLLALFSLLLPACSQNSSSNHKENTASINENEDYSILPSSDNSTSIETTPIEHSTSIKFPASGTNSSGESSDSITYSPQEAVNKELKLLEESKLEAEQNQENKNSDETETLQTDNPVPAKELLATFSTKVYTKTADRQKNLKIVCEKLSGTVLAPNQEFSYNETCGPYNKENGFGKATVFIDNKEVQDYGGGVCQLSSTLYNAIKDLNVEITERHLHSKKVYYVPDGQDATVSYGNLDFKFKNKNDYSLHLEAVSNAEAVKVFVYKE